jgi:glycosyltransferase involved in cell wall biosynthesis
LNSEIKILHVNTNDIAGGAARAAYRLHTGLRQYGAESEMFVLNKSSDDSTVTRFNGTSSFIEKVYRRFRREYIQRCFSVYRDSRPSGLEPFSDDRTPFGKVLVGQIPKADIVNLHWLGGFLDLNEFFERVTIPVVWTLHDMYAFTGGCHYNVHCDRYTAQCGACPQLGSNNENDLSRRVWQRKKKAYGKVGFRRLHLVAPCGWMAKEIGRSTLLRDFPVTIIPYGLDADVFITRDRRAVRTSLNIRQDARVVLFMSDSVTNPRKGFNLLIEALHGIEAVDNLLLVSIGSGKPVIPANIHHLHLGSIQSEFLMSVALNTADVFVITSLQDNLPNTVLEAMACGIPVVGFDTGGIPDMVRPGETGLLAPVGDVRALREAISQCLLDRDKREAMGVNCRKVVEREYTLEVQAKRYIALYEKILGESRLSPR